MKYPRERSARVGLTVPKGQTRKFDNNGVKMKAYTERTHWYKDILNRVVRELPW